MEDKTVSEILTYLKTIGLNEVDPEQMLFESGLIDSFSMVELIAFLEKKFLVRFGPTDLTKENLDTVSLIAQLVIRKRQSREKNSVGPS